MAFKEKYTTAEKVSKEQIDISKMKPDEITIKMQNDILEAEKVVLSNDAFAIGELLEVLSNKLVR